MHCYSVFGGCLCSDIELPDLSEGSSTPTWISRFAEAPRPDVAAAPVGEQPVGQYRFRLSRIPGGLRLELTEHYCCDILHGRHIVWYGREQCEEEVVRALLLGPVLALALEEKGALCLHGSAVTLNNEAIAFLAPKYHGKSTLALALVGAGARLLTDDTVAILPGPRATALPGVHSVRLWKDASDALRAGEMPSRLVDGHKLTLTSLSRGVLAREPVKLSAAYVLDPVGADAERSVTTRSVLRGVSGIMALTGNAKLSYGLIGRKAATAQFQRAVALAERVPVFTLSMVRDFSRLPDVVEQILRWHERGEGIPSPDAGRSDR